MLLFARICFRHPGLRKNKTGRWNNDEFCWSPLHWDCIILHSHQKSVGVPFLHSLIKKVFSQTFRFLPCWWWEMVGMSIILCFYYYKQARHIFICLRIFVFLLSSTCLYLLPVVISYFVCLCFLTHTLSYLLKN